MGHILKPFLVFTVICLTFLSQAEGLKCYACQSWGISGNEKCAQSPPPMEFLKDCGASTNYCQSQIAKEAEVIYAERSCGSYGQQNVKEECNKGQFTDGSTQRNGDICICSSDKCNSGQALMQWEKLQMLILVLGVMLISKMK